MNYLKNNLKQVVILLILTVGLVLGLYLALTQQIFKSRASQNINSTLKILDENNREIFSEDNSFVTESEKIKIQLR